MSGVTSAATRCAKTARKISREFVNSQLIRVKGVKFAKYAMLKLFWLRTTIPKSRNFTKLNDQLRIVSEKSRNWCKKERLGINS